MKHFNKFKEQLRPENQELPNDFSWEEMSDGIFEKMDQQDDSNQNSKSPILRRVLLLFTLLLCALFVIGLFISQDENSKNTSFAIPSIDDSQSSKNPVSSISQNEEEKQSNVENTFSSKQEINSTSNPKNSTSTTEIKTELAKRQQQKTKTISKLNEIASTNIKDSNEFAASKISNESSKENSKSNAEVAFDNSNSKITRNTNSYPQSYTNDRTKMNIPNKLVKQVTTSNPVVQRTEIKVPTIGLADLDYVPHKAEYISMPLLKISPPIQPIPAKSWTIDFGSGWNTWSVGFDNATRENDFYSNTSRDYGFSFSLRGSRQLSKKISLSTGLDLENMYRKLHFTETFLTPRLQEDAVVGVVINPISGKHQDIIRDTVLMDTLFRTTTNFNKFQIISIPLIVNYNLLHKNSWNVHLGFGPTISILNTYNGKYVEEDFLQDFSTASNIYSRGPKIALNASIDVRKNLYQDYYLGIRLDYKNHLMDWGLRDEAVTKPKIVSGLITIGKQF